MLCVKTRVVVVLLATRQKLSERGCPVFGQSKGLVDFQIHRRSLTGKVGFMSSRLAMIALVAGVALVAPAEARTAKPLTSETKAAKATKKKQKTAVSSKSRKKKKKREKKVPRIPDKTTNYAANMPNGFHWPPTRTMKQAEKICEDQLDALGITWEHAPPEGRIVNAIIVPSMELGGITYTSAFRKGPHKMDCQFARTLATFGAEMHALGVREIKFGSIYRNTTVRVGGKSKNILSRHALGIAMDVVSFTDETGREANVAKDYPNDDALLLSIEDVLNKSGKFRTVLTPRNDPKSHHDHFHLEAVVDYHAAEVP